MKRAQKYKVVTQWSEEDQCFFSSAPELGNCTVRAATKWEAMTLCEEAIQRFIEGLEKSHHPVPIPFSEKKFSGRLSLRIEPILHRNIATRAELGELSINQYIEKKLKESL